MSILDFLKSLLPFLMSAAEKAVKKLPKETQDKLTQISKMVEVLKQAWQADKDLTESEVLELLQTHANLDKDGAFKLLQTYFAQRGVDVGTFWQAVELFNREANNRTDTGLKSFFIGIVNILGEVVAGIDWKMLVLGVAQAIFSSRVKGRVKI